MALGFITNISSRFASLATESYPSASSPTSAPAPAHRTLPAITLHTIIALLNPTELSDKLNASCARPLLAVVRTPFWAGGVNPWRMAEQTPQADEPQRELDPFKPSAQLMGAGKKRSSSLPSAAARADERDLTAPRWASKRARVRGGLCTFRMRPTWQMGRGDDGCVRGCAWCCQLDLKIISTMLRPESSGPSSDTA